MLDRMAIERVPVNPVTNREEWLAVREPDVTASVIGALWGLHPWETIAGLYAAKRGVAMPEIDPTSSVIRRGNALEPVVAEEVRKQRPNWKIEPARVYLRDPSIRLGASPDFFFTDDAGRRGVLQTKTVGASRFKKEWDEITPPFWIALQIATEMMLDDADIGAIGALVVGDYTWETHIYDVPRHPATERRIRNAVANFWDDVAAGREPTIDYARDGALLAVLYPHETPGKTIDLTGDNELPEKLDRLERLKGEIKAAKTEQDTITNEIKSKMRDAEIAMVQGWRLTLKETHRDGYTVAPTSFRQLRTNRDFTTVAP
jgi:predicted phage-related endonuclease